MVAVNESSLLRASCPPGEHWWDWGGGTGIPPERSASRAASGGRGR